jgi:hypothetical protein
MQQLNRLIPAPAISFVSMPELNHINVHEQDLAKIDEMMDLYSCSQQTSAEPTEATLNQPSEAPQDRNRISRHLVSKFYTESDSSANEAHQSVPSDPPQSKRAPTLRRQKIVEIFLPIGLSHNLI